MSVQTRSSNSVRDATASERGVTSLTEFDERVCTDETRNLLARTAAVLACLRDSLFAFDTCLVGEERSGVAQRHLARL